MFEEKHPLHLGSEVMPSCHAGMEIRHASRATGDQDGEKFLISKFISNSSCFSRIFSGILGVDTNTLMKHTALTMFYVLFWLGRFRKHWTQKMAIHLNSTISNHLYSRFNVQLFARSFLLVSPAGSSNWQWIVLDTQWFGCFLFQVSSRIYKLIIWSYRWYMYIYVCVYICVFWYIIVYCGYLEQFLYTRVTSNIVDASALRLTTWNVRNFKNGSRKGWACKGQVACVIPLDTTAGRCNARKYT